MKNHCILFIVTFTFCCLQGFWVGATEINEATSDSVAFNDDVSRETISSSAYLESETINNSDNQYSHIDSFDFDTDTYSSQYENEDYLSEEDTYYSDIYYDEYDDQREDTDDYNTGINSNYSYYNEDEDDETDFIAGRLSYDEDEDYYNDDSYYESTTSLLPSNSHIAPEDINSQDWSRILETINSNTDIKDNFTFSDNKTASKKFGNRMLWTGIGLLFLSAVGIIWVVVSELKQKYKKNYKRSGVMSSKSRTLKQQKYKQNRSNLSKDNYGDNFSSYGRRKNAKHMGQKSSNRRGNSYWSNFFDH